MAINETIVTGRKFRKCIDAATKAWQRISFWTKSSDVEFEDGKNAETKLGAIDGITDSLEDTSSRMAASAKAVSTLNNNLGGLSFYEDATGKYVVGADSVPKKLGSGNYRITVQANAGIDGASAGAQNTAYFDIIDGIPTTPKSISSNQDWSKRVTCSIPKIVSVQEIN